MYFGPKFAFLSFHCILQNIATIPDQMMIPVLISHKYVNISTTLLVLIFRECLVLKGLCTKSLTDARPNVRFSPGHSMYCTGSVRHSPVPVKFARRILKWHAGKPPSRSTEKYSMKEHPVTRFLLWILLRIIQMQPTKSSVTITPKNRIVDKLSNHFHRPLKRDAACFVQSTPSIGTTSK